MTIQAETPEERAMLLGLRERQRREAGNPILLIKAECTQLGLSVEASQDGGATWVYVQLTPYKDRETRRYGWGELRTVINPAQDRADYFTELDGRGIKYKVVRGD